MDVSREPEGHSLTHDVARRAVGEVVALIPTAANDGVVHRLGAASSLRASVDALVTDLVVAARAEGATWAEIGAQLGVSTQAAHQKYRHVVVGRQTDG